MRTGRLKGKAMLGVVYLVLLGAAVFARDAMLLAQPVAGSSPPELGMGEDVAIKARLEQLGYTVKVVWDRSPNPVASDAIGMELLVISESISSARADVFIGATTPVLHMEPWGWDNWHFAGPASSNGT